MTKPCRFCDATNHTSLGCRRRPQKPLRRSPMKPAIKPLRQVGKQGLRWKTTRKAWIKRYGSEGHLCHYCGKLLSVNSELIEQRIAKLLTLDHIEARSRDPGRRYAFSNLTPACPKCNKDKGSLSHEEFVHNCYTALPTV